MCNRLSGPHPCVAVTRPTSLWRTLRNDTSITPLSMGISSRAGLHNKVLQESLPLSMGTSSWAGLHRNILQQAFPLSVGILSSGAGLYHIFSTPFCAHRCQGG